MKTATGLALLAIGAIFTFAVRDSPPGVNIHSAGWVIMLTGLAWILLSSRTSGWMQQVVVRRHPDGPAVAHAAIPITEDDPGLSYPQYVLHDPAALASAILADAELAGAAAEEDEEPLRPVLRAVRDSHEV
jgi:Domain of unknown function (DUF6458)